MLRFVAFALCWRSSSIGLHSILRYFMSFCLPILAIHHHSRSTIQIIPSPSLFTLNRWMILTSVRAKKQSRGGATSKGGRTAPTPIRTHRFTGLELLTCRSPWYARKCIIMDGNNRPYYEDEEMLEQYSLMAQAEANLRIRNMTGYSVESYRMEADDAVATATPSEQGSSSSNTNTAASSTLSNLRFTYPGTESRPRPELPERRMLLVGGGGGDSSANNGGVNNHSNTGELASSSRTSSSTASSFLLVGDSNSDSNHGLNDPSSNHQQRSIMNGRGGGSNHNVSSNRPVPKEPSFPDRVFNDRYDLDRYNLPPRPLEVDELCQGVVVADNNGDDENDHNENQRGRDGNGSGHDRRNSHPGGDTTPGFGSNSSRSHRSLHDHRQHDSNDNTINRSSLMMSGEQHHTHRNQSYHVVPCLSCRSRLRVHVLASLVSCPKCNTVNPAIGSLDNE